MLVGALLLMAAVACYVLNVVLIRYHIEKSMPGTFELDAKLGPDKSGEFIWEKTAGMGIVPRWISVLGLAALPLAAVGILILVVQLFSW
ncbi:MAG: hypothetical protein ACRD2R_04760 [Terriglobales bacterium]